LPEIRVLKEKCIGCGLCVEVCPFRAILLDNGKAVIREGCMLCGACMPVCNKSAILLERIEKGIDLTQFSGILIFGEQRKGVIAPVVYELLGKGRELADKLGESLGCVILGNNMRKQVEELVTYGTDEVYLYESALLEDFRDDPYTRLLVEVIHETKPSIFLLGATAVGRSLAPRVAVALNTGLTADCTDLDVDSEGRLVQTRPAFGGNVIATIICSNSRPQMATVRYKIMKRAEKHHGHIGEVVHKHFDESAIVDRTYIKRIVESQVKETSVTEAEIIVSGGKGLGNPEGFRLIRELANALGGAVGASRAVVDKGWIKYPHQVGLSGKTVRPRLYIACGISGAVQHLAGMQTSDIIVAINKDSSAPIFKVADYGIVGDVYTVVPEIIRLVKEITSVNELQ
jgi:electron transfer flavoprotein alpha subunit